jgi:flagellin
MRINNNIMAVNTHRQYSMNNDAMAKATAKLSSGFRINNAGDDAAGLAISEKMRAQIRGLNMASKNSEDAISLVQTAEGALEETQSILQRMRELAVQAASDTNEDTVDRAALDAEFQQLILEIDDISANTAFNEKILLDGTYDTAGSGIVVQTGANAGQEMEILIGDMSASGLSVDTLDVTSQTTASAAVTAVNDAINSVSTQRATLGAYQNRLEHKINNLDTSSENLQAAESRIRDIDMAAEMTEYTQTSILVQAATSMLAQANAAPQNVLKLLQ